MSNTNGQAYAFMTATPVLPGHEMFLLDYLASLPPGERSPLARMGTTHFARWLVMHDLVYQGPPQMRDTLQSAYLLFISDFDGALDVYLESMVDEMSAEADEIWSHCVAFPGTSDREAFARYLRHNQLSTTFFLSAYPAASVSQVRESLQLREDLAAFAVEHQACGAWALQQAWRDHFPLTEDVAANSPGTAARMLRKLTGTPR